MDPLLRKYLQFLRFTQIVQAVTKVESLEPEHGSNHEEGDKCGREAEMKIDRNRA